MRHEVDGALPAARRAHRPRPPGRGPLDRRPAGHRDRQGDLARRAGADHGRADRGAVGRRGRPALRRSPAASATRGGRCCSSRTGSTRCSTSATPSPSCATAPTSAPRRSPTPNARRARAPDGRPRRHRPVPEAGGRDRRPAARGRRACSSAGVFHDISFTVRAGEIVGLAGLVGAGRSEVARAVFGVDGYDSGSCGSAASRSARATPRRDAPGPRPRARGPPQAGTRARVIRRPQCHPRHPRPAREGRHHHLGLREPRGEGLGEPARGQDERAEHRRRDPLGRQPAEGRARQVARDRAAACSSSTSRPAASTSAPRPRCTACSPSSPAAASASS